MTALTPLEKLTTQLRRARARCYANPNRDNQRYLARWMKEWTKVTGRKAIGGLRA